MSLLTLSHNIDPMTYLKHAYPLSSSVFVASVQYDNILRAGAKFVSVAEGTWCFQRALRWLKSQPRFLAWLYRSCTARITRGRGCEILIAW